MINETGLMQKDEMRAFNKADRFLHKPCTPHRRYNPLTNEWILVSPHRTQRPWQGQTETLTNNNQPEHDPKCYLCPGNKRAGGKQNPHYQDTFVFTNDFAALMPEKTTDEITKNHPLLNAQPIEGTCRVICFSPQHNLTLASMEIPAIRKVVDLWAEQINELEQTYQSVQVFENKGAIMGCSNPHPHGQIWASNFLPNEIMKEDSAQRYYFRKNQTPLLMDYVQLELEQQERIVVENDNWLVVVPFWAMWPFETLLLPKKHIRRLPNLNDEQRDQLAQILKELLQKYDSLFDCSFPYSMGWHAQPANNKNNEHWQLHGHFYPPLLRSATIKKFIAGFELLAEPQRDITAEWAAKKLREL